MLRVGVGMTVAVDNSKARMHSVSRTSRPFRPHPRRMSPKLTTLNFGAEQVTWRLGVTASAPWCPGLDRGRHYCKNYGDGRRDQPRHPYVSYASKGFSRLRVPAPGPERKRLRSVRSREM